MNTRNRNGTFSTVLLAALVFFGGAVTVSAQEVISARSGLINYAGSDVEVSKDTAATWIPVEKHQQVEDGNRLRTGDHSRAEILLNPGSYLRLDRGTEIEFTQTDLPTTVIKLHSGSAILEAGGLRDGVKILVRTPQSLISISKDGLYRIDLSSTGLTELAVHKGEAVVSIPGLGEKKVGKEKLAEIASGTFDSAKLANVGKDEFDYWSQDRAETLIAANRALIRRSGFRELSGGSWFFDYFFGCYTFVPFGAFYFSPYFPGYGYWFSGGYRGGGYWGGGYWGDGYWSGGGGSGGGTSDRPRERLGKGIYTMSFKDPRNPIGPADRGVPLRSEGRYYDAPIHSAGVVSGGSSTGGAAGISSGGSAPPATVMVPVGRGKN